ncbi:MAG: PIN domain-containing protein [Candidatus Hydrothermarchaeales archaeon]
MKRELEGVLVLDAGVLIELVLSTDRAAGLQRAMLEEKVIAKTTEISITELGYILCRKLGMKESKERVRKLLKSGYIDVADISLAELASEYKCRRAISLADCYSISLARAISAPVIFAVKEEELLKEMKKKPFNVNILFLEELSPSAPPT